MNVLEQVRRILSENSQRIFLIEGTSGKTLSFSDLEESAKAIASDLERKGFRRGDRIAISLENSLDFAKLYFGCLFGGFVTVPMNPILSTKDFEFILARSGAKLLVTTAETEARLKDFSQKPTILKLGVDWKFEDLNSAPSYEIFRDLSSEDLMTIVFTSGTTSRPQGVAHRYSSMLGNASLFNERLGINRDNRFYGILAMTYLGGYYNLLMLPFMAAASVVVSNTFDARSVIDFWARAKAHDVNTLWLVPTIMAILLEMDRGHEGANFCRSSVRICLAGTAPLPVHLRKNFENRYGVSVYENYGLSETFFLATNSPTATVVDGSVGLPLPGIQVTILNDEGKAVGWDEEGEIHVSTPYLMEGYYDAENQQIQKRNSGSWFGTGDFGRLSATGHLSVTGRKKDLIIRGGLNVSPAAIENVLHEHPAVIEAAVVGIPHAFYGEEIAAAVKLQKGTRLEAIRSELQKLCRAHLGSTQQPSVYFEMDSFPKSTTGKIQKKNVKAIIVQKLNLTSVVPVAGSPKNTRVAPAKIIPGRVVQRIQRHDKGTVSALSKFPVSLISDALNRMGVMDGHLHAMGQSKSFCGPAVTVEEVEGGNLMSHFALEFLETGDVLVIDGKALRTRSCFGYVQLRMAEMKGAAAVVVNGSIRDAKEISESSLPVFALGTSAAGPLKGWGGNINIPISCAGVVVCPGDIIRGDEDGIVVIPKDLAEDLLQICEERSQMETQWLKRVEAGESTVDIVNLRQKLEEFGIRYL